MTKDRYIVERLGCQYIGPEQRDAPYTYCGCTQLHKDSVYCELHYPRVYEAGSGLRRRHKDARRAAAVWDIESDMNAVIAELEAEGFL